MRNMMRYTQKLILLAATAMLIAPVSAQAKPKVRTDRDSIVAENERRSGGGDPAVPGESTKTGSYVTYDYRPCSAADSNQLLCAATTTTGPCARGTEKYLVTKNYADGSAGLTTLDCVADGRSGFAMADVVREFEKVPLPDSDISVQPGEWTPVNFRTVFSTKAEGFSKNLNLAGTDVELWIYPYQFDWDPGDGTGVFSTDVPGQPYQKGLDANEDFDEYIDHTYLQPTNGGTVPVSVNTTWSAQFRVGDSEEWTDVDGFITIEGTPHNLEVRELQAHLTLPDS
jgi:hypothetical protein